jgi:hypothetical protein
MIFLGVKHKPSLTYTTGPLTYAVFRHITNKDCHIIIGSTAPLNTVCGAINFEDESL